MAVETIHCFQPNGSNSWLDKTDVLSYLIGITSSANATMSKNLLIGIRSSVYEGVSLDISPSNRVDVIDTCIQNQLEYLMSS